MLRVYGADPEVGVLINDILTPPAKLFEMGMKYTVNKNNKKVILSNQYGSIIEDGASFEFNVIPVNQPVKLYFNIAYLISALESTINIFLDNYYERVRVSRNCVEDFDIEKFLDNTDEMYDDCRVFRCDVDFYPPIYKQLGLETEDGVLDASKHPLRYFGGHIHVQNMSDNPQVYEDNMEFAPTVFDFLVGLTNVLNISDRDLDNEVSRMKVYGRPGRGRLQQYTKRINGYEYRPPSNNWLFDTESCKILLAMAGVSANVVENGNASDFVNDLFLDIPNMWETILTMNKDAAETLRNKALKVAGKMGVIKLYEAKEWA